MSGLLDMQTGFQVMHQAFNFCLRVWVFLLPLKIPTTYIKDIFKV